MARPRKVEPIEGKSETWNAAFATVTTALNKLTAGDDAALVKTVDDLTDAATAAVDEWVGDLANNFAPTGKEWAVTYTASGRTIPMVRFGTRNAAREWIKSNVRAAAADLYDTALVDVIPDETTTAENGK